MILAQTTLFLTAVLSVGSLYS